MTKKKYIVAVSGGVDSVVLLHKLMANKPEYVDYIVAHVDHNVRETSSLDAEFVEKMALKYNLLFSKTVLKTSKKDENTLREKRYKFLFSVKEKNKAESIITAHHQDDVIESMIINILRGTGPRGLNPMSRGGILRPLLNSTKEELVQYAKEHDIKWVEDESNEDESYLRNYVRKNIMPRIESNREQFLLFNKKAQNLIEDIDIRVSFFVPKRNIFTRSLMLQFSHSIAKEVMRAWLIGQGVKDINSTMIERAVIAGKTLPIGKKVDIDAHHWLVSEKLVFVLQSKDN